MYQCLPITGSDTVRTPRGILRRFSAEWTGQVSPVTQTFQQFLFVPPVCRFPAVACVCLFCVYLLRLILARRVDTTRGGFAYKQLLIAANITCSTVREISTQVFACCLPLPHSLSPQLHFIKTNKVWLFFHCVLISIVVDVALGKHDCLATFSPPPPPPPPPG